MLRNIRVISCRNYVNSLYLLVVVVISFVVIFLNSQSASLAQGKDITIKPNEEIQSVISKVMNSKTEKEGGEELSKLEEMVDGYHEKLIPELMYYSMQSDNLMDAMAAGVIIEQLGISKRSIALGLIPYLETKDEALRKKLYNWLGGVDGDDDLPKRSNFSIYESILRERKSNIPEGLIKYMYNKDAETALSTLARVYLKEDEARDLIEKAKENNVSTLDSFSKREEWWVRLYVAKIMKQYPKFHNPEIVERLKKDEHPLVQETLKEIE